jgi:hypothetical protein
MVNTTVVVDRPSKVTYTGTVHVLALRRIWRGAIFILGHRSQRHGTLLFPTASCIYLCIKTALEYQWTQHEAVFA